MSASIFTHAKQLHASFSFLLFLSLLTGCSGQQQTSKADEMVTLINQELKNQQNAKYGNRHPSVEVISDTAEVAHLRKVGEMKILLQVQKAEKVKTGLAEAYKNGDRSVVPAIVNILKGNEPGEKKALLSDLVTLVNDPEQYTVKEQAIIDLVLKAVDDPLLEEEAMQFAGINALPGYENKFESRLLSGKSTDAARLFFWLGKKGKSRKAFGYVVAWVNSGKINPDALTYIISGMEGYGENGDLNMKMEVGQLALMIYRKKLITDEETAELKKSVLAGTTSMRVEGLFRCLFKHGDKQVIPVAKEMLDRQIMPTYAIQALIRLEGPQHIDKVYRYLRSEDDFFTGLEIVESVDREYVDEKMLKEILSISAKKKDLEDYQVDRIVRSFIDLGAEVYLKNIESIIPATALSSRIKKSYALSQVSFNDIVSELIKSSLIGERPDNATIKKAAADASHNPLYFIYGILESKNLYFDFDTETDFLPVDYDQLLHNFSGKSNGLLNDMLVWMDVTENKLTGKFGYVITVIYKNHAFIARPEDVGDWYDIMTVNALLDKILEHSGSPKRFVVMETGDQTASYVFGIPAVIQEIIQKYKG
jgi:hypothetical protein